MANSLIRFKKSLLLLIHSCFAMITGGGEGEDEKADKAKKKKKERK